MEGQWLEKRRMLKKPLNQPKSIRCSSFHCVADEFKQGGEMLVKQHVAVDASREATMEVKIIR